MKSKKLLAIIMVIVLVVVVGGAAALLANSGKTDDSSMDHMSTSKTSNTDNNKATATDKVSIANFAFSPAAITVKVGTTVTWTNNDSTAHTVTADSGTGPDSGNMAPGSSYSFTYKTAGTFAYHCAIHSSMTGSVVVTQ